MSNYNTEFDVFPTQKMAQIERKSERTINRIDPINDQITKYYFDQISAHWSLIDRVIGSENERDLSNPGCKQQNNGWENIHHLSRHAILPLSLSLSLPNWFDNMEAAAAHTYLKWE